MNELRVYVEHLFEGRVLTSDTIELKEEIYGNLVARYEDLVASGVPEAEALEQTKAAVTSVDDVLADEAHRTAAGESAFDTHPTPASAFRKAGMDGMDATPMVAAGSGAGSAVEADEDKKRKRNIIIGVVIALVVVIAVIAIACEVIDERHDDDHGNVTVERVDGASNNQTDAGSQDGAAGSNSDAGSTARPSDSDAKGNGIGASSGNAGSSATDSQGGGKGNSGQNLTEDQLEAEATSDLLAQIKQVSASKLADSAHAKANSGNLVALLDALPLTEYCSGDSAQTVGGSPLAANVSYAGVSDHIDGDAIEQALVNNAIALMAAFDASIDRVTFTVNESDDYPRDVDTYVFTRTDLEQALASQTAGSASPISKIDSSLLSESNWSAVTDCVLDARFAERASERAEVDD